MEFFGNFFEHWERDVLTGKIDKTLWSVLRNMHFRKDTATESRAALNAWAAEKGVLLIWKHTLTPSGPDQWVCFVVQRDQTPPNQAM